MVISVRALRKALRVCLLVAYADGVEHLWDQYLRNVEDVYAQIPTMTVPGNHEIVCGSERRRCRTAY
jgi:hypothetical protein